MAESESDWIGVVVRYYYGTAVPITAKLKRCKTEDDNGGGANNAVDTQDEHRKLIIGDGEY